MFVSLLDEWDIGYPVIQAVFLDALLSLKRHVDAGHHGAEVQNVFCSYLLAYRIFFIGLHLTILLLLAPANSNSDHVDRYDRPIPDLEKDVGGYL